MNTRRIWPAYVALVIVLATAFMMPGVTAASPMPAAGGGNNNGTAQADGETPAQTGICVTGQVINKDHVGLPGLTILGETDAQPGINVQSADDGTFTFDDLTPGDWTFRVTVPDSWEAVTATEFPVTLAYGHEGCYQIRFKLNPVGCVIVRKTESLLDGTTQPGVGWTVRLSGPIDPEKQTDATGAARFDGLLPGTYVASEVVSYTWQALTPTNITVEVKASQADNDCAVVDFKNQQLATSCIDGFKVNDQHAGLPGWTIFAQRSDQTGPTFMTTTGTDGSFHFPNLTLGTWTLWEELPPFWTAVTPSKFDVTLEQGGTDQRCVMVRFKNRAPDICAEGYKVDENGAGLAGWTVTATSTISGTQPMTTTTDSHGHYRFNGLVSGTWVFSVTHQTGWSPINFDSVKLDITGARGCVQVPTFRNQSPRGCVAGFKRDDTGAGLPGWNILLQNVNGGSVLHRSTDGTGAFKFAGLPVGDYKIWEEGQAGWQPVSPTSLTVTVAPSDEPVCSRVLFVNKQIPRDICIDGYKLDSQGGVGLPGFPVTATLQSGQFVTSTVTDGLGYFRFGNLQPGTYSVSVGEKPGWVPDGPSTRLATVEWPPSLTCTRLKFWDRQGTTVIVDPPGDTATPDEATQPALAMEGKPAAGCRAWHTVKAGQTIGDLAYRYGVSSRALLKANNIANANHISTGQRLCIP